MMQAGSLEERLKPHLGERLYRHSRGVADTAETLAARYGADGRKARLAGLVHDFGKGYTPEQLLKEARRIGLELDPVTLSEAKLLHAPVGAALLPVELGITDAEIAGAVAYHTTGRAGMSSLEKIVYLADMIEPGRSFPGVEEIRKLAGHDLDRALLQAVEHTLKHVLDRGLLMHPRSVEFRNCLLAGLMENGG